MIGRDLAFVTVPLTKANLLEQSCWVKWCMFCIVRAASIRYLLSTEALKLDEEGQIAVGLSRANYNLLRLSREQ